MKILSVNVGLPREVTWQGKLVTTGIFKKPVSGPVMMRKLNLDGDGQADLTVHGGVSKAVYAYPSEHYAFWRAEFAAMDLPFGMFGENLTTEGLLEDAFTSGTDFESGKRNLWSRSRECPATSWASSLAAPISSNGFWPAVAPVFILP